MEENKPKKKKSIKKIILIVLLVILIILFVGIAVGYWYIMDKLNRSEYIEIPEEEIEINEGVVEKLTNYRNIALFGIDSRDQDSYTSGSRSDCIIIASINEDTNEVKLTSIYRDTYLKITGHSLDKVTHAYAYGGPALAISTLNTNLDLNITEFVAVNFEAVVDIVNSLGGVSVNITSAELNYINEYIDATSKNTGIKSKHITKAGTQTIDGVQAVAYCRIRYTSGGDYKRTERMRTIIDACLSKAKTLSLVQLNSAANTILEKIERNISTGELLALLPKIASFKITDSIGWPYEVKSAKIGGIYYSAPVTLESCVEQLHKELFGEEDYEVSSTVKEISESIIKKTGYR